MLQLSKEYKWDKSVFERAYKEVIESDFQFKKVYPTKLSHNKKVVANLSIEKNDTITIVLASIQVNGDFIKVKLFDKKNWWWYDAAYILAKGNKWFDNDRFGIYFKPMNLSVWYSLKDNCVYFQYNGLVSQDLKIDNVFSLNI